MSVVVILLPSLLPLSLIVVWLINRVVRSPKIGNLGEGKTCLDSVDGSRDFWGSEYITLIAGGCN